MSGRRRRDDEWGDGRLDAQDNRRDPWADDSIGEWGGHDADYGDAADRSRSTSGGAAGAYVRNASSSGNAYAAPDFPSFQMGGGSSGGDRYGTGSGSGSTVNDAALQKALQAYQTDLKARTDAYASGDLVAAAEADQRMQQDVQDAITATSGQ